MDLSYIINELGEDRELYFNAVAPPVMQTSNFVFPDVDTMRQRLKSEYDYSFYTRGNNPTVEILRKKMAALEHAEDALIFASGSAAIASAVMANINGGDHIISVAKPYSWTNKLLLNLLPRFGVETTMVDGTDIRKFEAAIRPETHIIYLESPNSFTFELQDLEAVAKLAKRHGILTMIDNSYASPLFQNPIQLGIDMVMHSASKYIGGHSDTVAGILCGSSEMMRKIFASEFMMLGGIIAPFNAWLLIRGLRTLEIRMNRVSDSTRKVVEFLENHPQVERMIYPYSPSHPQYELARKQMKKGTGQFTIALKANHIGQVDQFCNALRRFLLACSWGGHESLVFPSAVTLEVGNYNPEEVPFNLIRFYIGLEDPELLIEDLKQAFAGISATVNGQATKVEVNKEQVV